MKTSVVRARVPDALKLEFEATAAARGWNISYTIRKLMSEYVAHEKELQRRIEETLEALEDIESGRVVDGGRVMDWLAGWGTEDEQSPPR